MLMNRFEWIWECFLRLRVDVMQQKRSFIVWGTGEYGHTLAAILQEINLKPYAYVDQNSGKWHNVFAGQEIQSPDDVLSELQDVDIVLAMNIDIAQPLKDSLIERGQKHIYTMQEFVFHLLGKSVSILEIGPLHAPVFVGPMVKYFDVMDATGLKEKAIKHHLSTKHVPDVIDFVSPNGKWDMVDESFDMVYSAHVLEHQPDLIRHLQAVLSHVRSGGSYIMAVPDKRFCYNYYDPLTTLAEVLTAYYEKRTRHSFQTLLRAARTTHNDLMRHWHGDHGKPPSLTRRCCDIMASTWQKSLNGGDYIDAHAWYFTPDNFRRLISSLIQLDFLSIAQYEVQDTERGTNEFYVCLRKK